MFVKGSPKPAGSGRKKGVSLKASVSEICEKLHCDPIAGMCRIAQDSKCDINLRGRMYAELAKYVYPQKRAVETRLVDEAGNDRDIRVVIEYENVPAKAAIPESIP
jgi:hypothetical protein